MYVQLHMWARGARARARALYFLSRLAALRLRSAPRFPTPLEVPSIHQVSLTILSLSLSLHAVRVFLPP
jgi:hypothetical protein